MAACVGYLLGGNWRASLAPLASLGWCLSHPFDLLRRRRRSQSIRQPAVDALGSDGVFRGSILLQYYLRGRRTAAALIVDVSPWANRGYCAVPSPSRRVRP